MDEGTEDTVPALCVSDPHTRAPEVNKWQNDGLRSQDKGSLLQRASDVRGPVINFLIQLVLCLCLRESGKRHGLQTYQIKVTYNALSGQLLPNNKTLESSYYPGWQAFVSSDS